MTSEDRLQKSVPYWWRITVQTWIVTRHQYGISELLLQTSFPGKTNGSVWKCPSSETQGQMVGARESLIARENMARRKVNNGQKSPWGQCLTRPVPNCRGRSGFWLVPENFCVFLPNQKAERQRPFGTGLVRHCPQGLFSPFFTFLRAIFSLPFRLSLAPTICPWVSEDGKCRPLCQATSFWGWLQSKPKPFLVSM